MVFKLVGAIPEILSLPVLERFKEFYQNYQFSQSEQNNGILILLAFFSKFYLSWIMVWDLKLLNNQTRSSKPRPPCLLRPYRVKWWQEFNASHAYLEKVQNYFELRRQIIHHQHTESSRFLQKKKYCQFETCLCQIQIRVYFQPKGSLIPIRIWRITKGIFPPRWRRRLF